MSENAGRQIPSAKPVIMTFYDMLKTPAYTATFYVRESATEEECERLIRAVDALSLCLLAKYKIGYQQYVVPNYHKGLEEISNQARGTFKWQISYHTPSGAVRRHTIPGRNPELFVSRAKLPDRKHPLWQEFLEVFRLICVSKEGEAIEGAVDLSQSISNWPPKSAKKR